MSHSDSGSGSGILRDSPAGVIFLLFFEVGLGVSLGVGRPKASCRWWIFVFCCDVSLPPDAGRQSSGGIRVCQLRPMADGIDGGRWITGWRKEVFWVWVYFR